MKCQSCECENLVPILTRQGVEVDYCPDCRGVWLDKGEIFYFVGKPQKLKKELDRAIVQGKPSDRTNPHTGEPMIKITLMGRQLRLDYCPSTGGIWIDEGKLEELATKFGGAFRLSIDRDTMSYAEREVPPRRPTTLPPLPNLFVRSAAALVLLYGLIALVLITLDPVHRPYALLRPCHRRDHRGDSVHSRPLSHRPVFEYLLQPVVGFI